MRQVLTLRWAMLLLSGLLLAGCGQDGAAGKTAEKERQTALPATSADGETHGGSAPTPPAGKGGPDPGGYQAAPGTVPPGQQGAPATGATSRTSVLEAIKKRLGLMKESGQAQPPAGVPAMADIPPDSVMLSPLRQQLSGVRTGVVGIRDLQATIRTVGIVDYDERRLARIHTKFEGWIEDLFVDFTGEYVKKGDPLFTVYSPELVATQAEYLLALKARRYLEGSPVPEVSSTAPSLAEAAHRRLHLWDISDDQIQELERTQTPRRTLTIYSPITGIVLKKEAFKGMFIKPDVEIYQVADISTVWVNADVYEYELPLIRLGQEASVSLSYYPGAVFRGRIVYIYPYLQEKSRTIRARFELRNEQDPTLGWKLKPGMFSNVEVKIDLGKKLAIPEDAVLDSGTRQIVFVDKGEGRFDPREVKLGLKVEGYYEVLAGVAKGEKVATSANFLIDSESRLKGGLGGAAGHGSMTDKK